MTDTAPRQPSYRNRVSYHTTLLGGMAFIFSALVAIGNVSTKEDIAMRLQEDMLASLQQVLPDTIYDNQPLEDILSLQLNNTDSIDLYRARMAGKVVAVAFQLTGYGYAGPINLIMAIDKQGELLGVRVISHLETPGLGDKIETAKSSWIEQFTGLDLAQPGRDKWKVKKDGGVFDQFTGATITPRAVIKTIKHGLLIFESHQHEILDGDDAPIKSSSLPIFNALHKEEA